MLATATTLSLGNNESLTRGVFQNADGTWTALTYTRSRTFKTKLRALMWFRAACPGVL